jgi:hypothetical protein
MTADYVAMLRLGHRADDRAAIARGRRTPFDWKAQLRSGLGMRGEPDMFNAVRPIHQNQARKLYDPPQPRVARHLSEVKAAAQPHDENYSGSLYLDQLRGNPEVAVSRGHGYAFCIGVS